MEEKEIFKIKDENGVELDAEILSAFEMEDKNYVIYSTDENDSSNIYSAEIVINEDGTAEMKTIEDKSVKERITNMISEIINS